MLTGLCYCGVCGCKMRYQKWTNGVRKIYCCSRNKDLYYLPNFNNDCDNSIEWADNIENIVESEMLKISVNLSKYKPKEKENKIDIMQSQLDKEKSKLKRLYELYADGNDTVLDMIKDQESKVKNLDDSINGIIKHSVLPEPVPVVTTIDFGLSSAVLMNAMPAHVAGCKKIVMVVPHILYGTFHAL